MSHRVVATVASLTAAALVALPSTAAAATPTPRTLACGARITKSVVLAANIDCSSSRKQPALTIAAGNVTVNLNGHTVTTANNASGTVGVLVDRFDGVTITNGSLSAFNESVMTKGASGLVLDHLTVSAGANGGGIEIRGGIDDAITHVDVSSLAGAIDLVDSQHALIANTTSETDFGGSFGIASNHALLRNDAGGSDGVAFYITGSYNEIVDARPIGQARNGPLEVASGTHNLVDGGAFSATSDDGIIVDSAAVHTTVEQTTDDHNIGAGIYANSASTQLIDNSADDNEENGIYAVPGVYAAGNEASGNFVNPQCVNISCS